MESDKILISIIVNLFKNKKKCIGSDLKNFILNIFFLI